MANILPRQTTHCEGFRDTGGMLLRHHYLQFDVNNTQVIAGQVSTITGQEISVDWGDGSARSTYSGTDQAWSKDYGSAGDRTVRIFGSVVLTKFRADHIAGNISFDLANLPTMLQHHDVLMTGNTVAGDIANIPAPVTYFRCWGNNTITGDIANLPIGLEYFRVMGNNTITGDIANIPSQIVYLKVEGNNTIADYSGKTWTTKPATFIIVPVGAGGLSEAEIDQLFIDFNDDLVWGVGNVITLTGTHAAPSAASAAARTNIANAGCTITTN